MRIESLDVVNLLSYEEAHVEFGDYNVIVGPNDSGKTNLIRILRMARGGIGDVALRRGQRHDPGKASCIMLSLTPGNEEFRLLLQSLLSRDVSCRKYPAACRRVQVCAAWGPSGASEARPANTQVLFTKGLCAAFDANYTVLFDTKAMPPGSVFDKTWNLSVKGLEGHLDGIGCREVEGVPEEVDLGALYSNDDAGVRCHTLGAGNVRYKLPGRADFKPGSEEAIREITDYVKGRDYEPRGALRALLRAMMKEGIVLSEEMRPGHAELEKTLHARFGAKEGAFAKIREGFSDMFPGTEAESRKGSGDERAATVIRSGAGEFRLEHTASGHHAALHVLHAAAGRPGAAIIVDEPESHLHPASARRLGGILSDLASGGGNQVILATHSPEFVDAGMLDPASGRRVIRVARAGGASRAHLLPKKPGRELKPHLFDPRVLFGSASLLVEGPGDAAAVRAISDALGGALEKHSVAVAICGSVSSVTAYREIHERLGIPHVAMADKEYEDGGGNVVVHKGDLEGELGTAGREDDGHIDPDGAYDFVSGRLREDGGPEAVMKTGVWRAFADVMGMAGAREDEVRLSGRPASN